MSVPFLAAKLFVPPPRPELVVRPRLLERLNEGLYRRLTLISAPAGFGKTTLMSAWIADCGRPAAWVSLDEADSDPQRFLRYVVGALRSTAIGSFDDLLQELETPNPPPLSTLAADLVNVSARLPEPIVLVLDDYHSVDSQAVDDVVATVLDHPLPQLHIVIATREDPRLALARLRARDQLTELRAADLRFMPDEAAEFLARATGLRLTADDITILETRTEGWIAGLQLAALSMRGRDDVAAFVKAFAGDNRYVLDYLVDEVLHRQPESTRRFLLQTSILGRLSGALCDAVTEGSESGDLLDDLERANVFVVPLDDRRQWFRYHRLFADVLHAHLIAESPDLVTGLHRRASAWFAAADSLPDAVHHALAARDVDQAAVLIERAWPAMEANFEIAAWLRWARALPEPIVRDRPVLSAACAWAVLQHGDLEATERHLRNAERGMSNAAPDRDLLANVASARAYLSQVHGDVDATLAHGRRALDALPAWDRLRRGIVASTVAMAYWTNGELNQARDTLAAGMADMVAAGNVLFALRGTYILADVDTALGRLRDAIRHYTEGLSLAQEHGPLVERGTADLHLGLSALHYERDEIDLAERDAQRADTLGVQNASPHWRYRWYLGRARVKVMQRDYAGAMALFDDAARAFVPTPVPDVRPLGALRARVQILTGDIDGALRWSDERGLSADDALSYLSEFEHITLARVLIARHRVDADLAARESAIHLLERLLAAAEAAGRAGSAIEILVLLALAHDAADHADAATTALTRALSLAAPQGFVRVFIEEGAPIVRLLAECSDLPYAARLLAAYRAGAMPTASAAAAPAQPLVEPLSPRELEVLDLIAQGLSNREIADRLYLALNSVKGHNRNIFGKLGVSSRTQAVARARAIGLIASDAPSPR